MAGLTPRDILLAAVLLVAVLGAPIDPAQYIWLNYDSRVPILSKNSTHSMVGLPCQARLGECRYEFRLLPPGWQALTNGTLVVPRRDALKEGVFAVRVKLSEISGEKIKADLVVKISQGLLQVMDRDQFMSRSGYV